ncbi:major facilitator superfamily domain-containing protein 1 [Vairimorpha necatrix]|uniref:Lysosomal dipeptide transporter MFSD1 n=1 Tax=Vairimorpha necatrix TaxID=6039 RepID=A0AAX4JDI3_9MICR
MEDKFKILFLCSFILLSFSYVYDMPATLNEFVEYGSGNKAEKLAMLYSVYALPNIIIPLLFRYVCALELSIFSRILCFLVLVGQIIYSVGVYKLNYKTMLIGRFVYGLGSESFSILINRLLSKEFKEKGLAFTLGLVSSITRFGSILNFLTSPLLAERTHRTFPCIIGVFMTTGSLASCFILNKILNSQNLPFSLLVESKGQATKPLKTVNFENEFNPHKDEVNEIEKKENLLINQKPNSNNSEIFYKVDFNQSPFTPWESVNRDYIVELSEELSKFEPKKLTTDEETIFYEPSLAKSEGFHSTFYLLAALSFIIALIWAPFYSLAPIFFNSKYNINSIESGHLLSIIEVCGIFLTPFVGFMVDKYGKNIYIVFLGCLMLLMAHVSFTLQFFSPYFIVGVLGIAGPLVGCYWPCIPVLVSEKSLTNGFAVIFSLLNLAFTISPFIMGLIMSKTKNYEYVELFIIANSIGAMAITGLLIHLNIRFKLGLNRKNKK